MAGQVVKHEKKHVCIDNPGVSHAFFAVLLPGIATALRGTRLRDLCWQGWKGREKLMTGTSKELAVKSENSAHTFTRAAMGISH